MGILAIGIGIGTKNSKGEWIEVFYPKPLFKPSAQIEEELNPLLVLANQVKGSDPLKGENAYFDLSPKDIEALGEPYQIYRKSEKPLVLAILLQDKPPTSVPEAYLKLHLISHRLVRPRTLNLDGIFRVLPIVAWTNQGPIDASDLPQATTTHRLKGKPLEVTMVDKFPRMTDYVVPEGIRIADATRVRLGAYVGAGTTVMQEGFINYNAGTEGPNMVEGRISAGVFVGAGSDLGGGCSTMGTLSGGNSDIISVGRRCLIGANAGIGISLGDDCTVEAGLYLTAASKVAIVNNNQISKVLKARELSGKSNLLFRRNSQNGAIECLKNKASIQLNPDLHV